MSSILMLFLFVLWLEGIDGHFEDVYKPEVSISDNLNVQIEYYTGGMPTRTQGYAMVRILREF